jgi:hypothetical protein
MNIQGEPTRLKHVSMPVLQARLNIFGPSRKTVLVENLIKNGVLNFKLNIKPNLRD